MNTSILSLCVFYMIRGPRTRKKLANGVAIMRKWAANLNYRWVARKPRVNPRTFTMTNMAR